MWLPAIRYLVMSLAIPCTWSNQGSVQINTGPIQKNSEASSRGDHVNFLCCASGRQALQAHQPPKFGQGYTPASARPEGSADQISSYWVSHCTLGLDSSAKVANRVPSLSVSSTVQGSGSPFEPGNKLVEMSTWPVASTLILNPLSNVDPGEIQRANPIALILLNSYKRVGPPH